MKYDIFSFDLDDTIIKTENFHYNIWLITLKQVINNEFFITLNEYFTIFHSIKENSIQNYLKNDLKIHDYENVIKIKNEKYYKFINENKDSIKMIDGCENFINKIIHHNKKFIIVSNTLKEQIDFFLELFPILKHSTQNYYREILKNKKPNSECYINVINDFPNNKIIGFEDSITGIHALSGAPEITTFYVNTSNYLHHRYILDNYNVTHINNYNDLLIMT